MGNDARKLDELKGELHRALQVAIETADPNERTEALCAVVEQVRELAVSDAEALFRRLLALHGIEPAEGVVWQR